MKISLYAPDSKYHNLAMMKLSSYWKRQGAEITWNFPMTPANKKYCSVLFNWTPLFVGDWSFGGPGVNPQIVLSPEVDSCFPDYSLYPTIDYSVGYTFKFCPWQCPFCVVPKQNNSKEHFSIHSFHDPRFKKISLLNNNTFADPRWRETFDEIEETKLIFIDQSGFDLRLISEEKISRLARLKIQGNVHFAWDQMVNEEKIIRGFRLLKKYFSPYRYSHRTSIYVLVGYDTTLEQDIYRIRIIAQFGLLPFIMNYNKRDPVLSNLARLVNRRAIFRSLDLDNLRSLIFKRSSVYARVSNQLGWKEFESGGN